MSKTWFPASTIPKLLEGWQGPVVISGAGMLEDGPGVLLGPDSRPEKERVGPWEVWRLDEQVTYDERVMSTRTEHLMFDMTQVPALDRVGRAVFGAPCISYHLHDNTDHLVFFYNGKHVCTSKEVPALGLLNTRDPQCLAQAMALVCRHLVEISRHEGALDVVPE